MATAGLSSRVLDVTMPTGASASAERTGGEEEGSPALPDPLGWRTSFQFIWTGSLCRNGCGKKALTQTKGSAILTPGWLTLATTSLNQKGQQERHLEKNKSCTDCNSTTRRCKTNQQHGKDNEARSTKDGSGVVCQARERRKVVMGNEAS